MASGCDATWASWSIGLVGYGAFVALFVRLAARSLGTATAWVVGALLVLSPRLWAFATEGVSDVPFLVAVTLAVVYLRYVGVFLFPAVIAVALLTRTRLSVRQASVACTVAGLAILPLLLRNIAVSGTVGGSRLSTNRTLLENPRDVGIGIANLFLPTSIFNHLSERVNATA